MADTPEFSIDEEALGYLKELIQTEKTLNALGARIEEDEKRTAFLNLPKARQVCAVFAMAYKLFEGTNTKVNYELHKPYQSMGYVTIEGSEIVFKKALWLSRLAEFASNFEIYPLKNGRLRLTYTFHGLTVPVK